MRALSIAVKPALLTIIAFLFIQNCFSQSEQKKKNIVFGLQAGLNFSDMVGKGEHTDAYVQPIMGANAGCFAEIGNNHMLAFKPGVSYSRMGNNTFDGFHVNSRHLNYITVPLLVKYNVDKGVFSIFAGPQFGFLLTAKSRRKGTPTWYDIKGECEHHFTSGILGVAVEPFKTNGLGISLAYQAGFTPIYNNDTDGKNLRFSVITCMLQYEF